MVVTAKKIVENTIFICLKVHIWLAKTVEKEAKQ
jgi:hypothetical protein